MPGTQPNIIIIRDGAKPYGGMITFDLQWFPPCMRKQQLGKTNRRIPQSSFVAPALL